MAGGYEHPLTEEKTLKPLSAGCEVIAGGVEEHVMCSFARCWKDGREIWFVARDSEADGENLIKRGQLPDVFAGIEEELRAEQEAEGGPDCGVDFIFSAPDMLTKALTGFHFDESGSDEEWHALVPEGPRKSWLGGLFGK